jgi:hypothetical protein
VDGHDFYPLAMVGMMPFGNLLAGSLAQWIDALIALTVCGSICIVGAILYSSQVAQIKQWIQREIDPYAIE